MSCGSQSAAEAVHVQCLQVVAPWSSRLLLHGAAAASSTREGCCHPLPFVQHAHEATGHSSSTQHKHKSMQRRKLARSSASGTRVGRVSRAASTEYMDQPHRHMDQCLYFCVWCFSKCQQRLQQADCHCLPVRAMGLGLIAGSNTCQQLSSPTLSGGRPAEQQTSDWQRHKRKLERRLKNVIREDCN